MRPWSHTPLRSRVHLYHQAIKVCHRSGLGTCLCSIMLLAREHCVTDPAARLSCVIFCLGFFRSLSYVFFSSTAYQGIFLDNSWRKKRLGEGMTSSSQPSQAHLRWRRSPGCFPLLSRQCRPTTWPAIILFCSFMPADVSLEVAFSRPTSIRPLDTLLCVQLC